MINKYSEDYVSGYCSGYTRAEVVGKKMRKDACSQLGTAVLDNLLDVMDGYAAKGYEVIPVDDVKMEICLCIGRLFRKCSVCVCYSFHFILISILFLHK